MRIIVSDYSGHPFQVQLSRALAGRGHDVLHISSASMQTPKGKIGNHESDPQGFASLEVRTREPFAKHAFLKRRRQEIEVGGLIAEQIERFRPDIVLSSNAPLDTQRLIQQASSRAGAHFVFWVQDLYSTAMLKILPQKFGPAGTAIGRMYRLLEARMLRRSDHVVVISSDFAHEVKAMAGIREERLSVVENWAPLDEIPPAPRNNEWAQAELAPVKFRAVYSGTLGYKHNPALLLKLARALDGDVLVFSEGPAAEALARDAAAEGVSNLRVSSWLPFAELPQALAAADLLIVILEPEAGAFSVPSKVLTYMCVGRAILGSIPGENLAARLITGNQAGIIVEPSDEQGFVDAALALADDPSKREAMARNARAYAEAAFDIDAIASRFEQIFYGFDLQARNQAA